MNFLFESRSAFRSTFLYIKMDLFNFLCTLCVFLPINTVKNKIKVLQSL